VGSKRGLSGKALATKSAAAATADAPGGRSQSEGGAPAAPPRAAGRGRSKGAKGGCRAAAGPGGPGPPATPRAPRRPPPGLAERRRARETPPAACPAPRPR
jgi:hypothetical protein